jgi:hypothetical protein
MSDEPDNLNDKPFERRHLEPHERDLELERKVQATLAKGKRDRADPKYNVLNAAVWYRYAGHVSNRITDLEAYLDPMCDLLGSFRAVAREADNAADLINILEKAEAYQADASRYVQELRKLSDAMDSELSWYTDEIFREWGHVETEQGDNGDLGCTSE